MDDNSLVALLPMQQKRIGHTMVIADQKVYVFGQNSIEIMALASSAPGNDWQLIETQFPTSKSYRVSCQVSADLILVAGGYSSGYSNEVHLFNTQDNSLKKLFSAPFGFQNGYENS